MTDSPLDALARGRALLRSGDRAEALRWLDRAHRLAPGDCSVSLLLASAFTGIDDGHGRTLLRALVAAAPDLRDAAVALILAELRAGEPAEAARLLGRLLLSSAPPPGDAFSRLADAVARAAGAPGWIGADSLGRLRSCAGAGRIEIAVDGAPRGRAPARAGVVTATVGGMALLGSGLDLAWLRRTRGAAWLEPDGSLSGWAWLPGDPDSAPPLDLTTCDKAGRDDPGAARTTRLRARAEDGDGDGSERRRRFRMPAARLAGAETIRVAGEDGTELTGSPLPGAPERRAARAAAAAIGRATLAQDDARPPDLWRPLPAGPVPATPRALPVRHAIDVVMPVHRGEADFSACLATLRPDIAGGLRVIVVDDASADRALLGATEAAAARGEVVLLRHAHNRGFPAAANTGLRHALGSGPRDVVLLNPDTLLPAGWLARLASATYGAGDVGSATPMTGDGSIVSYAGAGSLDVARLDALFRAANGGASVPLPTGVGFCMMLRHDCLAETGLLREDLFAQGYGEENDWSLRATALGWRHVACAGLFVAHRGGGSFGPARARLVERNLALLNRLHPGYDSLVARFEAADPLAPARRRVDRLRWAAGRRPGAVVLVTHDLGGGVERHLRARVAAIRADGLRAVVLRPAAGGCAVSDGLDDRFADLDLALPGRMAALLRLLGRDGVRRVELHHLLGHAPEMAGLAESLGVPCDVVVHDYAAWCPRVSLCSTSRRYCGEPLDQRVCEDCVADLGSRLDEPAGVAALRARSGRMLRAARRVVAPCADAAERIARQFPGIVPVVAPWEDDSAPPATGVPAVADGEAARILVMGAIGVEKGYDVLLACVRDAGRRGLPLRFVVAGHTMDDERLLGAGPAFVSGRYEEHEAAALARRQGAQLGFVPSVWPETWCYALSELWRAGLEVAAFDLGAQAERIRRAGHGLLLPLGLPPARVNDALLRAALDAGRAGRQMNATG